MKMHAAEKVSSCAEIENWIAAIADRVSHINADPDIGVSSDLDKGSLPST